jgi:hypothetical protein
LNKNKTKPKKENEDAVTTKDDKKDEIKDKCHPNPCKSGGTCELAGEKSAGYICNCQPSYYGQNCQIRSKINNK